MSITKVILAKYCTKKQFFISIVKKKTWLFQESQQNRVNSWKAFQAGKSGKSGKSGSSGPKNKKLKTFKPPKHKAESR